MEALQREVGPFTVGVWLIIGVSGVGLALLVRRFTGGDPIASLGAPTGDGPGYMAPGSGATGLPQGAAPDTPRSVDRPTTNDEWRIAATRRLLADGASPLAVDQALRAYLEGRRLTDNQQELIDAAIAAVGPTPYAVPEPHPEPNTPEPTPPTSTPTTPTTPSAPKVLTAAEAQARAGRTNAPIVATIPGKPRGTWAVAADGGVFAFDGAKFAGSYPGLPPHLRQGTRSFVGIEPAGTGYVLISNRGERYRFPHTGATADAPPPATAAPATAAPRRHTVATGETLSKIGQRYGVSWQRIYNANANVIGPNPNMIRAGQVLVIPT